jgi:hypothetical protein
LIHTKNFFVVLTRRSENEKKRKKDLNDVIKETAALNKKTNVVKTIRKKYREIKMKMRTKRKEINLLKSLNK